MSQQKIPISFEKLAADLEEEFSDEVLFLRSVKESVAPRRDHALVNKVLSSFGKLRFNSNITADICHSEKIGTPLIGTIKTELSVEDIQNLIVSNRRTNGSVLYLADFYYHYAFADSMVECNTSKKLERFIVASSHFNKLKNGQKRVPSFEIKDGGHVWRSHLITRKLPIGTKFLVIEYKNN